MSLVRCLVCGTLETVLPAGEPGSGGLGGCEDAYLPHADPGGLTGRLARRSRDRKTAVAGRWMEEGARLVDVGCGSGGFLAACRRRWPHRGLTGMEPDPGAASAAAERGFQVLTAGLDAPLPGAVREAGLYTLWHVLEHVEDPLEALVHLREALAPGGRILVVVPNARAWERSLWGRHTVSWDPPRHRWHLSPRGLASLAEKAGLEAAGRFTLFSDDVYDGAASLRWLLYRRAWTDRSSVRGRAALTFGLAAAPLGALVGMLAPRDRRASMGWVLERAGRGC
ncbi:MAG: class I SAM-dependent methyltransferase [bacterium]